MVGDSVAVKIAVSIQERLLSIGFHTKIQFDATLDPMLSPHVEGSNTFEALLSQEAYASLTTLRNSNSSTKTLFDQYPALRKAIESSQEPNKPLSKPSSRARSPSPKGYRERSRRKLSFANDRGRDRDRRSVSPFRSRGNRRSYSPSRSERRSEYRRLPDRPLGWRTPAGQSRWRSPKREYRSGSYDRGNATVRDDSRSDRASASRGRYHDRSPSRDRSAPKSPSPKRTRFTLGERDLKNLRPSDYNGREVAAAWRHECGDDVNGRCFMGRLFVGRCTNDNCKSKDSHDSASLLPVHQRLAIFDSLKPRRQ